MILLYIGIWFGFLFGLFVMWQYMKRKYTESDSCRWCEWYRWNRDNY